MGYAFGDDLESFSLTTYNNGILGTPTNDGTNTFDPSVYPAIGYDRRILVLSFINVYPAGASSTIGGAWFNAIKSLKADASLVDKCDFFVVAFRYDSGTFYSVNSIMVRNAIALNVGVSDTDFAEIPIVLDNGSGAGDYGLYTYNHLQNLWPGANPVVKDVWVYVTDRSSKISDKWHTSCSTVGDPISFNRFRPVPDPGVFNSTLATGNAAAYLKQRILNLYNPLSVLSTIPAAGSVITSASAITKVYFSRPLANIGGVSSYRLTGGGVSVAPVEPSVGGVTSLGADLAENGVALDYAAGGLTDATGDDSVNLTVNDITVRDESVPGSSVAGPFAISFTAHLVAAPQKVPTGAHINAGEAVGNVTLRVILTDPAITVDDTVELFMNGAPLVPAQATVLTAGDISLGYYDFSVPGSSLGADGAKSFTMRVRDASSVLRFESSALVLTLDRVQPTVVSGVFELE